jgi:ComF family protein
VLYLIFFRRWIFSSPRLGKQFLATGFTTAAEKIFSALFSLVLPDDCRICGDPLKKISRIPVCPKCLAAPEPLAAEYMCAACRAPFASPWPLDEHGLCGLCRRGAHGFDAAYSYGFYEGTLRELIHLLKYGKVPTLAGPLGRLLALAYPRDQRFDVIVPVPMHWRRRWDRGFNQAELLAQVLGRRIGVPVCRAARRRRATPPQAGLTSARRRENVTQAFSVRKTGAVKGRRVLLVDDVLTTGATVGACALALKRAGAKHVAVITVARADRRPSIAQFAFSTQPLGESA